MSTNIFSVYGLISWLGRQDPATEYDWQDQRDCLGERYLEARGVGGGHYSALVDALDGVTNGIFITRPWTYGAALARAKSIVGET